MWGWKAHLGKCPWSFLSSCDSSSSVCFTVLVAEPTVLTDTSPSSITCNTCRPLIQDSTRDCSLSRPPNAEWTQHRHRKTNRHVQWPGSGSRRGLWHHRPLSVCDSWCRLPLGSLQRCLLDEELQEAVTSMYTSRRCGYWGHHHWMETPSRMKDGEEHFLSSVTWWGCFPTFFFHLVQRETKKASVICGWFRFAQRFLHSFSLGYFIQSALHHSITHTTSEPSPRTLHGRWHWAPFRRPGRRASPVAVGRAPPWRSPPSPPSPPAPWLARCAPCPRPALPRPSPAESGRWCARRRAAACLLACSLACPEGAWWCGSRPCGRWSKIHQVAVQKPLGPHGLTWPKRKVTVLSKYTQEVHGEKMGSWDWSLL